MATLFGSRWEITEPLSEGGQAHTYLVRDTKGGGETLYVLKRLKNPDRIQRFKQEIEAVRSLSNVHIVRLVDFDLSAAKPYLVTEYCRGGALSKASPDWFSKPDTAFNLFLDVCDAVAYAHDNGIIHRDLKPENIFLKTSEGPAVVGDFGICYLQTADERFTETHEAVGPRIFMAPELEDGRLTMISPKSDMYSLGKLLYWLLSKGRYFSREKYRSSTWDLKDRVPHEFLDSNIYMEHVNRLLDHLIVHDPNQRAEISDVVKSVQRIKTFLALQTNVVSAKIQQRCTYCGWGTYRLVAKSHTAVHNFGLSAVGNPDWRIFVCGDCGHVQMFKLDEAQASTWWEKDQ